MDYSIIVKEISFLPGISLQAPRTVRKACFEWQIRALFILSGRSRRVISGGKARVRCLPTYDRSQSRNARRYSQWVGIYGERQRTSCCGAEPNGVRDRTASLGVQDAEGKRGRYCSGSDRLALANDQARRIDALPQP